MKKVLMFPGAFNPPHLGHISSLKIAVKNQSFDEIWIVPSGKRDDKNISISYEDRRNLGRLFVEVLSEHVDIPVMLMTNELDDVRGRVTDQILEELKARKDVEFTQLV